MTIATTAIETESLASEQAIIVKRANDLTIACGDDFTLAGDDLKAIKTYRKQVEDTFGPHIKAAHDQHKALLATKNKFDTPAAAAEATIKRKMGDWQLAERRRAEEAERKLREEARKAEEDRRLAEAAELERQGKIEQAAAVIEKPVETPVVVVKPDVPKVKGVSFRSVWKHRIVNPDLIPRQYLIPDEKRIAEHARSLKEKAQIAGVEFYEDTTTAATGY